MNIAGDVIQLIGFAVAVAAAAVWLRSSLTKQRHEELENLAVTRGHRVADLELRVQELHDQVAELRGQVRAIQDLKAEEIADAVVAKLATGG